LQGLIIFTRREDEQVFKLCVLPQNSQKKKDKKVVIPELTLRIILKIIIGVIRLAPSLTNN